MKTISAGDLIAVFQRMYSEHWTYEMGKAEEGCVDCSGAFVYAFKQLGGANIPHGSNSIYRNWIGWVVNTPTPGYAAFKIKNDGGEPAKFQSDGIGNVYHIGLVDSDGQHILNAKGTKYGFCRDKPDNWTCYAPIKYVDYGTAKETGMDTATVKTNGGNLNLRGEPSSSGQRITGIPNGETVSVLDTDGDWTQVTYGKLTGWVKSSYLVNNSQEDANSSDETVSATTTLINTEGVAITLVGSWRVAVD